MLIQMDRYLGLVDRLSVIVPDSSGEVDDPTAFEGLVGIKRIGGVGLNGSWHPQQGREHQDKDRPVKHNRG